MLCMTRANEKSPYAGGTGRILIESIDAEKVLLEYDPRFLLKLFQTMTTFYKLTVPIVPQPFLYLFFIQKQNWAAVAVFFNF